MVTLTRRFGAVARDAANRAPGEAGGWRVLHHERATLKAAGREDLARRVIRVSQEAGDGAGHDIAGFTPQGRAADRGQDHRLLGAHPFHIGANELAAAEERRGDWCLFRLWNRARQPPPSSCNLRSTAMPPGPRPASAPAFPDGFQPQSSTTFPERPERITSKPSAKSAALKRCVITFRTSSPFSSMAIILYQVSKISRP